MRFTVIEVRKSARTGRTTYKARYWVLEDGREREVSRTHSTRKLAKVWLAEQQRLRSRGELPSLAGSVMTLGELYSSCWSEITPRLAPSTVALYEHVWAKRVEPAFGGMPIARITVNAVEAVAGRWAADLSLSATQDSMSVLSALLGHAARDGLIPGNPVRQARRPRSRRAPTRRHPALSAAEVERLAVECSQRAGSLVYGDVIRLLAWSGLRWSEATGLLVGDVDVAGGVIEVRRALVSVRGQLVEGPTKNGGQRLVPIVAMLDEPLARLMGGKLLTERVVTGSKGGPLRNQVFRKSVRWTTTRDDLGFQGLRVHDLRGSAISAFLAAGVPLSTVRDLAGHASVQTTNLYSRGTRYAIDAARAAMDAHNGTTRPQPGRIREED